MIGRKAYDTEQRTGEQKRDACVGGLEVGVPAGAFYPAGGGEGAEKGHERFLQSASAHKWLRCAGLQLFPSM